MPEKGTTNEIGVPLAMSFSFISIILLWNPSIISQILPLSSLNYIIGSVFGLISILGILVETNNSGNNVLKSIIKFFFSSVLILLSLFFPYILLSIFGNSIIIYIINYLYIVLFLFLLVFGLKYLLKNTKSLLLELRKEKLIGITKLISIVGPTLTIIVQFREVTETLNNIIS